MEIEGVETSSIRYKRYKEGNAINKRIIIGTMVQTDSRTCESIVYKSKREVVIKYKKTYVTESIIKIKITIM